MFKIYRKLTTGMMSDMTAEADPGFPIVGHWPSREGVPTYKFQRTFQKKCMKLRKFWAVGGTCAGGAPLRSATGLYKLLLTKAAALAKKSKGHHSSQFYLKEHL